MTKQTEALKLALNALEETVHWRTTGIGRPPEQTAINAITALREALALVNKVDQEQPAQQEPVAVVSGYYGGQCVILPTNPAMLFNSGTAFYTSPQPAQQQVFVCSTGLCHYKAQQQEPAAYWIPKAEQFCIASPSGRPFAKAWEPLYTSPPASKPWVGLTQEDWMELKCKTHGEVRIGLDVAAKLREKNA